MPSPVSYSVYSRSMHARESYRGCLCSRRCGDRTSPAVHRELLPGWMRPLVGEFRLARPEVSLSYETISVCFLLVTVCVLIVSR